MSASRASIVWFRNDLRLADNPALSAAVRRGGAIVPVFIWRPEEEGDWSLGGASRWWLHQSLAALSESLAATGSRLIIRRGASLASLRALLEETRGEAVFWNRRYGRQIVKRDATIKAALRADGVHAESFNGACLFEPVNVKTQQGAPYQVFTAFWKACRKLPEPSPPLKNPKRLPAPEDWPGSTAIEALGLAPKVDWAGGLRDAWSPGEQGASRQLKWFLSSGVDAYETGRDRPDQTGTSRLSPHLHFGEISSRQIWHAVKKHEGRLSKSKRESAEAFLREVGWREFAHHLLFHFPRTPTEPLRERFRHFPWARSSKRALAAWQRGRTGYPIVDAGMRELWATGWMHNRVRMIVGSFLVKDLLIDWREGAAWFWDTLVDADLANNTLGWQWVAGCGADAAPYFRVFNPVLQGRKFDPEGAYVRRWVPALAGLPAKWIHAPWDALDDVLAEAGVVLGENYPVPIVDHATARKRALAAYEKARS